MQQQQYDDDDDDDRVFLVPSASSSSSFLWVNGVQEDTAVQRAKRALKAQLKLRGEAAGRAQALRGAREKGGDGLTTVVATETTGNEGSDGARQEELQELEDRIATASKVGVMVLAFWLPWGDAC